MYDLQGWPGPPNGGRGRINRVRNDRDQGKRGEGLADIGTEIHGTIEVVVIVGDDGAIDPAVPRRMGVPAGVGMDRTRGVMIGVMLVGMGVNEQPQQGGHRHRHRERSRHHSPAHVRKHIRSAGLRTLKSF